MPLSSRRRTVGLISLSVLIAGSVASGVAAKSIFSPTRSKPVTSRPPRIVFQSGRAGNLEIYTMNADGSGVTRLTKNRTRDVVPVWSPDGRKIAFTSSRDGNRELYVMNADGSDQRRLTHESARDLLPTWSPDGHAIAFVRESKRGTFAGPIYIVNADGSGERKMTETRNADCCLAWSPDGEWIAYVSDDLEIYLLKPDGSRKTRLTRNKAGDCCPAWSPTGGKLAFARDRNGNERIYVMNRAGTSQMRISSLLSIRPAFSPDGRRLAFEGLPARARACPTRAPRSTSSMSTAAGSVDSRRTRPKMPFPTGVPTNRNHSGGSPSPL